MGFTPYPPLFPGKKTPPKKTPPKKKPPAKGSGGGLPGIDANSIPDVPTTTGTAKGSQWQQFVNYWSTHGAPMFKGQTAQSVYAVAKAEHIDPILFGALILNETRGNFNSKDSSAGAIGIGQLEPGTFIGPSAWNGGVLPWNKNHQITLADLRNPGINLRLSAAYYAYLQGKYPTDAYGRYNAGENAPTSVTGTIEKQFEAQWITKWNPKYTPTITSTGPAGAAGGQVPGGGAPPKQDQTFKDPYVTGVSKGSGGKLSLTNDPTDPHVLQYDGAPLTRSNFLTLKDQLTSSYVSYTGQQPSNSQIATYLTKGWNTYTLASILSKGKNFVNSPIYKQTITAMNATLRDVLPQGAKIPPELARQAVLNQWDSTTLAAMLRKQPGYIHSEEFKGNMATLQNVHNSIMGQPDAQGVQSIQEAALAGWTTDQYAAWLRSQPNYTQSPEYQSKALSLLQGLGLITGATPVLKPGTGVGPGGLGPASPALPTSPLFPKPPENTGSPGLPGLGETFNG